MKKKILIIAAILIVVVAGVIAGVYFSERGKEAGPAGKGLLEKEDFSVILLDGWQETNAPTGVSAMVVNINEEITDPAAQRINFRTYFSITYDTLSGRSRETYLKLFKDSLKQMIPGMVITLEEEGKINNRDAYFGELEFNQRGIDFKVLIALISGEGEGLWAVSFNTAKSNWNKYKDLSYEIVGSFKIKTGQK